MAKLLGVTDYNWLSIDPNYLSILKRSLLLFDKLAICNFDESIRYIGSERFRNEIHWLLNNELLIKADIDDYTDRIPEKLANEIEVYNETYELNLQNLVEQRDSVTKTMETLEHNLYLVKSIIKLREEIIQYTNEMKNIENEVRTLQLSNKEINELRKQNLIKIRESFIKILRILKNELNIEGPINELIQEEFDKILKVYDKSLTSTAQAKDENALNAELLLIPIHYLLLNNLLMGTHTYKAALAKQYDEEYKNMKCKGTKIEHSYRMSNIRVITALLREVDICDAYPIYMNQTLFSKEFVEGKTNVLRIVIERLPIPDDSTPWEQIIDYRNDSETKSKFLALKDWMNEMVKAEMSLPEIEDKLEYLLNQYENHMKLHKLKYHAGVLESIIILGSEIIEDLIRLKIGKVTKSLFSLKQRKLNLLEAELKAPGRSVAYILRTQMAFS